MPTVQLISFQTPVKAVAVRQQLGEINLSGRKGRSTCPIEPLYFLGTAPAAIHFYLLYRQLFEFSGISLVRSLHLTP